MSPLNDWLSRLWSTERRQVPRQASLPLVAYYWDGAPPVPRQVRDISTEGMYLLTDQRWYPNTLINMTLLRLDKEEDDPDRAIRVTSRVIRTAEDGVGFAFVLPLNTKTQSGQDRLAQDADERALGQFLARLRQETGLTGLVSVSAQVH